MIKVKWELDEAVIFCDVYIKSGRKMNIEKSILEKVSILLNKRAKEKGLTVDDKFRNVDGLSLQIRCIHYIVTNATEGLSNVGKIFYEAYELLAKNPQKFYFIVEDFYKKYCWLYE